MDIYKMFYYNTFICYLTQNYSVNDQHLKTYKYLKHGFVYTLLHYAGMLSVSPCKIFLINLS